MNKPLLILGAGGHGRVLAQTLRMNGFEVSGFIDPGLERGTTVLGYPVLGDDSLLSDFVGKADLVNGIGSLPGNAVARRAVFEKAKSLGFYFQAVIHASAIIAEEVILEEGVQIMAGTVLQTGALIGMNSIVNTSASIDHDAQIGHHCHIGPGAVLCGGVSVSEGVTVGAGSTIIQGMTLGRFSAVAAGAVVTEPVPEYALVAGVPAKIKKMMIR